MDWFLSRSLFCVLDYHGSKMLDWPPLRNDENLISSEGREKLQLVDLFLW
jgi:hypothetical protein